MSEDKKLVERQQLQKDCGIPHLPTQLTAELRVAPSGEGPRAYEWSDKPHWLLYDACREVEAQAAEIERLNETVRRVQAAARTLETTRCEIYQHYVESSKINAAAVSTLDSEREANALLTADIEVQAAEIARLRNALLTIAQYDVGLQGHLEDFGDTLKSRLDYAERMIRWRITAARAALGGNDE